MIKRIQAAVKKSLHASRMRRVVRNRNRHLIFQQLEDRRVLAGFFDEIADEISGAAGVLAKASQTLDAISSVAKLPLINKKLEEVDNFNDALNGFRTKLDTELRKLNPCTANSELEEKIVELLGPGPGGAKVLANRAAPATIGVEDVDVVSDCDSVDIVMDLGISDVSFNSSLGLGIDSVPLKPDSSTNGAFKAGVYYRNFRFGYDAGEPYVNTLASNELELTLDGFLPDSFSAGLGFLNVRVTDQSPGTVAGPGTEKIDEDVTITLKADVTDTGISTPVLGIDLDFQAHVKVATTFEGLPELETDFVLQWELPAVSPEAPLAGGSWTPPTLAFNNVTLSVGSFIKSLAQPIARYVKDVIEPLEPVFNLLETRIPGISDVAETFGQPSINLVTLSQLLALSPNPPTQFIDAIRSAAKLRDLYTTISSLADRNASGAIRLGSFRISGPEGKSLLNTSAALSNLGLPDWSSLTTPDGGPNLEEIKRTLRNELGAVGGEIADVLTKLSSKAGSGGGDKAGFTFSFPIIENPADVALGMFLGRDKDLVSVGLDLNLELKKDIFVKIVPGVSIKIAPRASVNAATEIGYDTRGLREAMQPLYIGGSFDPNKLLNGLWMLGNKMVDGKLKTTHIDVSGSVGVGPVLGLPDIATVDVLGGVQLDVHAGIYNPSNLDKLRFFAGDFNAGKLFELSGTGKANLTATVKVGGEIPAIGFVGFEKTWTLLETTFFHFSTDFVPMPGSMVDRPIIVPRLFDIEDVGEQKMLRLKAGPFADGRGIGIDANNEYEKDEDFTVEFVGLGLNVPGALPRIVPVVDVKAFGVVQRYRGRVDYISAQMGDGNDKVQVTDWSSNIIYSISGDDGDDKINVDGNKSVYITGGDGDDTIDGGNGRSPSGSGLLYDGSAIVDGGNGRDTVSFGDGRLENLDPGADYFIDDSSTDFMRDRFRIDNERSETDTLYRFQSNESVGDLWIQPKAGGAPSYLFRFDAAIGVDVHSGTGDDDFLGFPTKTSSLYGGYGDDKFHPTAGLGKLPTAGLGGSGPNPSFFINIYGGEGTDSIIADDSPNTQPREYHFNPPQFFTSQSNTIARLQWEENINTSGIPLDSGSMYFSGTEDLVLKSGSESDTILISGFLFQGTTIESGAGDDRIVIGAGDDRIAIGYDRFATIRAPLTINSGEDDDTFEIQNVSNGFMDYRIEEFVLPDGSIGHREVPIGNYTVPVNLEGGEGNNTLRIDDRNRRLSRPIDINQTNYQIESDQFHARPTLLADDYATIRFNDLELRSIHLSDDPTGYNRVDVFSLGDPSDDSPGDLVTVAIQGYGALDRFTLFPHDDQGNASLLRPIALDGGSNSDQMVIDDTNSLQPMTYTFGGEIRSTPPFRQFIGGVTPDVVTYSPGIQTVELRGGHQSDTINLDFTGFIRSLSLSGGPGNDVFNVARNSKDTEVALFIVSSMSIDGGSGTDYFFLQNNQSRDGWFYTRDHNYLRMDKIGASYSRDLYLNSAEIMIVSGGTGSDGFSLEALASDETMAFEGGAGFDRFFVAAQRRNAKGILGQVVVDAGDGGGSLYVFDSANTTGSEFHVEQQGFENVLGSRAEDTLFGTGGGLRFRNLTNDSAGIGLSLVLGSGKDTIYARPQTNATLSIDAGEPSEGINSDSINLALADAQNYVIQSLGVGQGNVTSSNFKPIQWTGIEQVAFDAVAPKVISQSYQETPASLISLTFDEDISSKLALGSLDLLNVTTGQLVPVGGRAVTYDPGTNTALFTFPGYPGGRLPAGSYTAGADIGLADLFGNPIASPPRFSFGVSDNSQPNVISLPNPAAGGFFTVASPVGSSITAAIKASAGVALPTGVSFPFGFIDFTIRGIAPGAAADVTITGLNLGQITDYFKFGATPANNSAHWYNFLFGQVTDGDSAVGTGMEIVNGSVVLHLIDGQRGDDDLLANGVIVDIGGPVFNLRPVAIGDVVRTNTNTPLTISVLENDSDSDGTLTPSSVVVVGAASRGTTSVNPTTGAITYRPATNFTGSDSFTYQVRDNLGAVSNAATVSVLVDTPPVAVNDTASTLKNAPVVIPVLGNDRDPDGTINASSVTIVGQASHGTTSVNAATGAITYTPASNYFGPDSFTYQVKDNLGVFSNVATVSINVVNTGTISGKEFLDVTGNGLTIDDLPLSGVRVFLDTNNNGVWNSGEPTSISQPDGTFKFTDLIAGNYKVRQVAPTGFVRTAPTTSDFVSVAVTAGQDAGGNSFANAALGNLNVLSNVVYVINGTKAVSDLRGKTDEGDVIQVTFTLAAGTLPQRFTLVSYTAPEKHFDPDTASQQRIFDVDSGVFAPGTHTLTVSNPHSYFQIDFVSGFAIDRFGPEGSNITYTSQNRLASADNGGKRDVRTSPASLTGSAFLDANNNGVFDANERPIAGVTVSLTGATSQTVVTDSYGAYTFDNLPAGTYTITETQPGDYADGTETLGNKGGTKSNDKFSGITLAAGAIGTGYNFGELQSVGSAFFGSQTQSTAWWNGSSGQALIKSLNGGQNAKNLGNWLATNFENLFGSDAGNSTDLSGKTNAQVATYYQSLYSNNGKKAEVGALALALAVYVTKSSLAGNAGTSYGFVVSAGGLGSATASVGASGAAFGVSNNTVLTISELLSRTNARARKGMIWDADDKGSSSSAEKILRDQAGVLFNSINNT